MAYKFPWTNYHELNLDWILDTVKKLFAQTEQNNAIVEQYDGRLTEVELTADNAQTAAEQAQQNSTAALDLAQGAQTTATQAQQAAAQAQQAAGQAQTAAGQAQEAAATAQQTATQAQQTAQNFDGRIRQAEDNAASALQAAQAFDEQVQGAITAANNANEAATAALTTSAETARELAAQRDTLEDIIENATQSLEVDLSTKADVIINTAEGEIASFNDGADDMPIKKLVVNIEPVQAGSGDPSPTNVRPISGHTGAEIEQTGKNLLDGVKKGSIDVNTGQEVEGGTAITDYIKVIPGAVYTISKMTNADYNIRLFEYGKAKEFLSTYTVTVGTATEKTFVVTANAHYIRIQASNSKLPWATPDNYQLELGSTATAYEPYTGNQISVNWEDEAGTVYGGQAEIISGKLTDNMKSVKVSDLPVNVPFEVGTYACWKRFTLPAICKPVLYNQVHGSISSMGVENSAYYGSKHINEAGAADVDYAITAGGISLAIYDSDLSLTDTTFMEKYGDMQVVYPLAETVEYTLTENEIDTLYGQNNIWSDIGNTEVTYLADTKTYIDNKFAELQALILEH